MKYKIILLLMVALQCACIVPKNPPLVQKDPKPLIISNPSHPSDITAVQKPTYDVPPKAISTFDTAGHYREYCALVSRVKANLQKLQDRYKKDHGGLLLYELITINLFPFYCTSQKDTFIEEYSFWDTSYTHSGRWFTDLGHVSHIQIPAVYYVSRGSYPPLEKTYKMFSYSYDFTTDKWVLDGLCTEVKFQLINKAEVIYNCR
jgi:hypothetical protein